MYYNYCSAVAAVSTDGYEDATTDPTYVPTYGLVTSAACGSSRATIPIFVGESYCNQITTTNTVYTDVDFEVRCEIDRDGATQPTSYDILVDGGVVRSGTVNRSMTHIVETIRLTSGTHQVACLIK